MLLCQIGKRFCYGFLTFRQLDPHWLLREMFHGRLISLRGDVEWPARSPDLSPCDVFLLGITKGNGFQTSSSISRGFEGKDPTGYRFHSAWSNPESDEELPGTSSAMCCHRRLPYVWSDFWNRLKKQFLMYFSEIYSIFFLDSFFHFLYLFGKLEIFMPHLYIYLYIYTYIYVCRFVCIYILLLLFIYVRMYCMYSYMFMRVSKWLRMCVYLCTYLYVFVCMYLWIYVCMYVYYICAYICVYIYMYVCV